MNKTHILPTTIAMAIGISGVLLVLFAWGASLCIPFAATLRCPETPLQ